MIQQRSWRMVSRRCQSLHHKRWGQGSARLGKFASHVCAIVTLSREHAWQLLQDLLFYGESAETWVQDVWTQNEGLGESAAALIEITQRLWEQVPESQLRSLLRELAASHPDRIAELESASDWQAIAD